MSLQSDVQAAVRAITGTQREWTGDWHALFDQQGIPAGPFASRLLAYYASVVGASPNLTAAGAMYAFLHNPSLISGFAPYLGQLATHSFIPDQFTSAFAQTMSRVYHVATTNITSLQLRYANWYGTESLPGGAATVTSSIEYPAGTLTQVKFGGVATGNIPDGGDIVSDATAVAIPKGAGFWSRTYYQNAAGVPYKTFTNQVSNALGEGFQYAASGIVDQTMTPSFTYDKWGTLYGPSAIIGMTTESSIFVLGDSIVAGAGDTDAPVPGTTEYGLITPSLFPDIGFISAAKGGEMAVNVIGNQTRRAALGAYCSHIICELGINDLTGSRTAAELIGDLQTIAGYFPGKRFYTSTLCPVSSSTDGWTTVGNQTPDATSNPKRITYNDTLRSALPAGIYGYLEVADQMESARNSGRWKANYCYADDGFGIHPNSTAYGAFTASNVVDPANFPRY